MSNANTRTNQSGAENHKRRKEIKGESGERQGTGGGKTQTGRRNTARNQGGPSIVEETQSQVKLDH